MDTILKCNIGSRGLCISKPSAVNRSFVGVAAAKNNQKNKGLYFEYEAVDPEAASKVPLAAEKQQAEFSWAQQARRSAGEHRQRRESSLDPPADGRRQGNSGRGSSSPAKQRQQQNQNQKPKAQDAGPDADQGAKALPAKLKAPVAAEPRLAAPSPTPATAPPAPAPASAPAASASAPAATTSTPAAESPATSNHRTDSQKPATGSGMDRRKQQLLQRMQGTPSPAAPSSSSTPSASTPNPAAVAAAAAATVAAAATAAAVPAPATPQEQAPSPPPLGLPLASVQQLPAEVQAMVAELGQQDDALASLPDLGQDRQGLEDSEEQVLQALQSWFVDSLQSPAGGEQGGGGGSSLEELLGQDAAAQQEFEEWIAQLEGADEGEGEGSGGPTGAMGTSQWERMLETAAQDMAELRSLGSQLQQDRKAMLAPTDGAEEEREEESMAQVMARLQRTDPELYQVLSEQDGDVEEEDDEEGEPLALLGRGGERRAAGAEEVSDAELEEFLRSADSSLFDDDASFLNDADDEDGDGDGDGEGGEHDVSDLFDAIDEDEELDAREKMRMTHSLQGIFNVAAEAASAPAASDKSGKKAAAQKSAAPLDPAARGLTTTGLAKGSGGEDPEQPPPLLARPRRR